MELDKFYINFRKSYYSYIPGVIDSSEICHLDEEWYKAVLAKKLLRRMVFKDVVEEIFPYLFKTSITSKYILPPKEDSFSVFEVKKPLTIENKSKVAKGLKMYVQWDHEEFASEPFLAGNPHNWPIVHGVLSENRPSVQLNGHIMALEPTVKIGKMVYYRFSAPVYRVILPCTSFYSSEDLIYVVSDTRHVFHPLIPLDSHIIYENLITGMNISVTCDGLLGHCE